MFASCFIHGHPNTWNHYRSADAKSFQSCPTLCDTMDCSLPGSSVHGIFQAIVLEWVAISFSNAWKWKVKVKSLSRVWLFMTPWTAAYQAPPSVGFSRQEYWSGVPLQSCWILFLWLCCLVACSCVCFAISNCELMFNWGTLRILGWDAFLQRGSMDSALHLEALKSRTLFSVFSRQKFCIELPDWEILYYLHPPLKREMATHSSTLAWKIPLMEDPGRLQFMRSQRIGHDWATSL